MYTSDDDNEIENGHEQDEQPSKRDQQKLFSIVSDVLNAGCKPGQQITIKDISVTKTEDANGFTTLNLSSRVTNDKKQRKKRKKRKSKVVEKQTIG